MARRVQVLLVDDLDGSELGENGETVAFGVGSERYEIDLSHDNAEKFRDYMGRYVSAARNVTRVGGKRSNGGTGNRGIASSGRTSANRDETKAARAWLIEQGILSADSRGRISQDNWERYRQRGQLQMGSATKDAGSPASKMSTAEAEAKAGDTVTAAKGATAEASSKPPRGNSQKAGKASAKGAATPEPATSGLASLLP